MSENFNIFLELPLKILIRKKIKIISINWKIEKKEVLNLKLMNWVQNIFLH